MSTKQRRSFRPEFRLEAAQLVVDKGDTIRETAAAMSEGHSTMDRWVTQLKKERKGETPAGKAMTPEQREIQALKQHIRRVEEHNAILKKDTVLLMSDELNQ